ncbi:MAG: hypothetical protein EPO16_04930 [Dehalococcoidia bacterium]|nr:MAG: hypothetical protein EPO16_04930 [Dehalococcoidia bacterium]
MDETAAPPSPRGRLLPASVVVAAFLVALLALLAASWWRDRRFGEGFDIVRWERETVAGRWLFLAGAPLRNDPPEDEALRRYFALSPSDPEALRLENRVERIIEGRIDSTLAGLGIHVGPPLPGTVFPFVDIELASSPRVLVESPRARIERVRADLLRPDLGGARAAEIEARAERERPDRRAIVVPSGGVATYPAIVSDQGGYVGALETAAHEWVHHYLTFYPLGRSYFIRRESEAINETVADLIGEEIAASVLARWGDPTEAAPPPASATPAVTTAGGQAGRDAALRALRLEVDALLAAGKVEEAEARMERVRLDFVAQGMPVRVLNQAFFAWYGTYAARPDSVDPLGGQLREIRARSGDLPGFVREVRGVASRADVEALLARMRAGG